MTRVAYAVEDKVAILTLDNPPLNVLSAQLRADLHAGLARAKQDAEVYAVVIAGRGSAFSVGADVKEFGKPLVSPRLAEIMHFMESMAKPVIAALHGNVLGGGLELALACHWRIATGDTRVGLPEVNLGLMPGGGGTQRLPRLIGPSAALDVITSGKPISAKNALELGIIDRVSSGNLVADAAAFARQIVESGHELRVVRNMSDRVAGTDPAVFAERRKSMERRARGLFAPWRCIDAIEAACTTTFDEGLALEAALFRECLESPQARALSHVFFAEREASRIPGLPHDLKPGVIGSVAVIGSGTMGAGIAMCFANAGIPVKVLEASADALKRGLDGIRGKYEVSVQRGSLTSEGQERLMSLISGVLSYEEIGNADVVVEAVFEDMTLKKEVFAKLDTVMKPGAILGTNTSTLDIDAIASATKRPEDVIGIHFFSPANVMRLLEVVRGKDTSPQVIATVMTLGKTLKKVPVLSGNCDGFIGNRAMAGYLREAEFLLEEGATPEQVDGALEEFGLAMGPFRMRDMAGLDVGYRIRQGKAHLRPKDLRYSPVADRLYEMGRLGQKNGAGYYKYDGRKPVPDPQVHQLIEQVAREQGIERRQISNQEIVERCLYPIVNEGARLLEEGIALRASDIDIVYLHGYGFPIYRGGPMFWAEQLGLDKVLARIREFQQDHGKTWEPAPLLVQRVEAGNAWEER